jgi:hypothetical protein
MTARILVLAALLTGCAGTNAITVRGSEFVAHASELQATGYAVVRTNHEEVEVTRDQLVLYDGRHYTVADVVGAPAMHGKKFVIGYGPGAASTAHKVSVGLGLAIAAGVMTACSFKCDDGPKQASWVGLGLEALGALLLTGDVHD